MQYRPFGTAACDAPEAAPTPSRRQKPFGLLSIVGPALVALSVLPPLAAAEVPPLPCAQAECVSLEGKAGAEANPIVGDRVRKFATPVFLLFRSRADAPKGTVLLFPGGGYGILEMRKEGENTARVLNDQGFDGALLEYHVSSGPQTRDLALADALKAFRFLKSSAPSLQLHNGRLAIMGYSAGGHLAARTVQNLGANEQPQDLILIYPAYLNETTPGSANPAVTPPAKPLGLFALIGSNDRREWIESCQHYVDSWKAGGGAATFHLLPATGHGFGVATDSAKSAQNWPELLKAYFAKP